MYLFSHIALFVLIFLIILFEFFWILFVHVWNCNTEKKEEILIEPYTNRN